MLQNYLKTAWRNIKANRLFAILNIAGLAFGLCVCIILFAYVSNELSFDRMYKNEKNIYRVNMETMAQYNYKKWSELPNAVGPALMQNIQQVKYVTRLIKDDFGATASLKVGDNNFVEKGLYLADPALFKIFDFDFTEGNIHTVFAQPHSIVLSQSAKERLFGNGSAFGKIIYLNSRDTLHVSGVYKNLPENSTIDCDMIYNIMDSWMGKNVSWSNASFETYCLLEPHADLDVIQRQATALINKYVEKDGQYYTRFLFQPLSKIHLYSAGIRPGYSSRIGSISNVKGLLLLSLLVLLIACINYMNLATARSQRRSKGVGVNKVLGANSRQVLLLFYIETGVLSLISIIAGYPLAFICIPVFRDIAAIELRAADLYAPPILICLFLVWAAVTILAGSYPAIAMSRVSVMVLMNKMRQKHSFADTLRKALVVFQFGASIILIVSVIIIFQQMQFMRNRSLGYNPKGVVSLSIKSAQNNQQIATTVNDMERLANVESVSAVQSVPGDVESGRSVRKISTDKIGFPVKTCHTDGSIVKTMQLQILAGNPLPPTIAKGDTTCYALIN